MKFETEIDQKETQLTDLTQELGQIKGKLSSKIEEIAQLEEKILSKDGEILELESQKNTIFLEKEQLVKDLS